MKKMIVIFWVVFSVGCASKKKNQRPIEKIHPSVADDLNETLAIDYERLQVSLGMSRPLNQLGYSEKAFPTCEVGYGYSPNKNCRQDYFVLIHFQLMCRDSHEDTYYDVLKSHQMRPLKGRAVRWNLGRNFGAVNLDEQGFGQLRLTSRGSQRGQRLKITVGNDNLRIKAGDIRQIITPPNWCN